MARNRVATNNLFGWQATMRLNGPTGTTTAASNSNTAAAVAMMFNGSAGQEQVSRSPARVYTWDS
jgi:hypothetical protein